MRNKRPHRNELQACCTSADWLQPYTVDRRRHTLTDSVDVNRRPLVLIDSTHS